MLICLKTLAKFDEPSQQQLVISERLPDYIETPCRADCVFEVKSARGYYLLDLAITANLSIICQRCACSFSTQYVRESVLALCRNEERAEELLSLYESIVVENDKMNLIDIVTDDILLYAPIFHPEGCDWSMKEKSFL